MKKSLSNKSTSEAKKRLTNTDLARKIDQAVNDLAAIVANQFNRIDKRFDKIETDVGTLKIDVGSLKTDVGSLKEDMASVKYKLYEHDGRFDSQDERLEKLEQLTQSMNEDLKLVLPNHEFRIEKLEKLATQ